MCFTVFSIDSFIFEHPLIITAAFIRDKNDAVAVKIIDIKKQQRRNLIIKEVEILRDINHPNMVNFIEGLISPPTQLWVVMEYMDAGK